MSQSQLKTLKIWKLVATGNDFVFVDARKGLPAPFDQITRAELAQKLCHRHFGVGADGLVVVEGESKLKWDFFNSDGSHAEMCGNATRCMGRWAASALNMKQVEFETVPGTVRAQVVDNGIASTLNFVRASLQPIEFQAGGRTRKAYLVNTGVPHAVVEIESIHDAESAKEEIKALRFHPQAGPRGANVTFLEVVSATEFSTTTFERGVEGFTLSCGTGVLAAASVGLSRTGGHDATLATPGGMLHVHYGVGYQGVVLTGAAELIFETEVTERILE